MQSNHRRLASMAAAASIAAVVVGSPAPASADANYVYGTNYPNGVAAVNYIYDPSQGTWRPLTDMHYLWEYYPQWATQQHPFGRNELILVANGGQNYTARDANGHLLLDFNHDGALDVTNAGHAFHEHNARGAQNRASGDPFTMFWFDDNWLARYMAQAYGRPLPDGLSDYSDFTRWRVIGGSTSWVPYGTDAYDQLALDGLYYLALGQATTAMAKWIRIRDKVGLQFDFHTGLYIYPGFTENYHLGLFKILTEQLLVSGRLSAAQTRELVQHSASLRSSIIDHQEIDASTSAWTGWTSAFPAGTSLMNTESIAVGALALGAGAVATFGAGEAPLQFASGKNYFRSTDYGILSALAGFSLAGHMTFGPYFTYPARTYTVDFVMRSASPTGTVAHLDVYDADAGRVLAERDVTAANLGANNEWGRMSLAVAIPAGHRVEFRTWWYGNSNLEVAEIRLR